MFSIGEAGNKPSPSLKTTKGNWIIIILTNVDFISGCAVSLSFCAMFARKRIPINIDQSTQKPFSAHVCLTTWRKDFLYPSRFPLHQRSALRDARWAWFHRSKWKNVASFLSRMDVTIWKRDSLKVSRDYDAITYYLLRRKSLWFQPRHLINPSGRKRSVIKKSKRKN